MSVPYIVGYPIKDPNNFYGFHGLVKQLYDIVGGRQAQSVSLLGLKRSGKTSLLHYLSHPSVLAQHVPNPDAYVMLYIDFSTCDTPTRFYRRVYKMLLQLLGSAPVPGYEQVAEPDLGNIAWLLGQYPDRRVLLLLDEFDLLTQGAFDQSFLLQLRALAGARDTDLAFITASFKSLEHMGDSLGLPSTSPFYNIFYPSRFYLSGFHKTEVMNLIRQPAEQEGVFFTDQEIENIQAMAGTLPFLLQMSACKWFLMKRDGQFLMRVEIQKELVDEASPFFESWWRDLEEENRLLLGEIARKGSVSGDGFQNPESEEGLRFLKNYGLVIEEEGTLRVNGLILATWICERTEDERIRTATIKRLTDNNWQVRQAAVASLSKFAISDIEVRRNLLRRLDDDSLNVQRKVIKALSKLVATDPEVRMAIFPHTSKSSYKKPSLNAIARDFFSAAGFEVRELTGPLEFVCHSVAVLWKTKIDALVYTQCLLGYHLDRNTVMNLYESAKAVIDAPKLIFVVIDQTPDESGLIEIGALRAAEGVQVIPLDWAIIQQGRELQKEQEELREYLSRFIGRGINLYEMTTPVVDRLNFFGRETRASELSEVLSTGRPLGLFGLRKMGKSSLVQYLYRIAPFPVAYVDLQASEELVSLYNRILRSWQRSLQDRLPGFDWAPPAIAKAEPSSSFVTAVHDLMSRLEAFGHLSRLGLIVDEIEVIVPRLQDETGTIRAKELKRYMSFARALRGIVQETDRLSLLMVGVDPHFNRVSRWLGQQNPFYQFFREEYLEPLGREHCIEMIRNIGRQIDLELEYTDEAAKFVADASGGHPFLARQLCSATLKTMEGAGTSKIELNHLLEAAKRFIREPGTADLLNENGLWGEVTDPVLWPQPQVIENRNILTGLARSQPQRREMLLEKGQDKAAFDKSVSELEHRAVINQSEQLLEIRCDLFRQWIKNYQLQVE